MLFAQRIYAPHSVLATGNWYKLSIRNSGVYKIDLPFLNALGVNTTNLSSNSIRLYGNGGGMLPESNAAPYTDDLVENAIMVVDGGDGVMNGNDYMLFYGQGPDKWIRDSINLRFKHQKDLFSEQAYYFLTIGGNGKRISTAPSMGIPNVLVNSFSERFFHELDTVNFLASGKDWYGEEFANIPGKVTSRDFPVSIPNIQAGTAFTLISQCIARSIGTASRFDVKIDAQPIGQFLVNPTGAGIYDLFAQQATALFTATANQPNLLVNYNFVPGSFNAQAWLDWFELFARRQLIMNGGDQLPFRDWLSVGAGNIAQFTVGNATNNSLVWDITEPAEPVIRSGTLSGNEFRFVNDASRLREYVAFNPGTVPLPQVVGRISNQDLHNTTPKDYIIISYAPFSFQAQRLAQFHQDRGFDVQVVTTDQVYHEFGSGRPDPVAIRDFLKMYHDRYGSDPATKLTYVLFFGDASFDYKDRIRNNTNYVPAWENNISLDPLATYASDDFFGFLDNNEDINSTLLINYLDVGIGRVPAGNIDEAKNFVDKVMAYHAPASFGPWRNNLTFIADDEDFNLHLQDAEILTSTTATVLPDYNIQKIYLDAFRQESGTGGSSYPQANLAINNQVFNGTLIWNYNGHGGARRLAEETILDQESVNSWNNPDRLPLFITATCDFAPYDNPGIRSLGENILLRQKTGGIALMTTTRVVFAFSNRIMNDNYLRIALERSPAGIYKSLGEAVMAAKNYTYQTSGDVVNNRKFTLLGDPAMTISFPVLKAKTTTINGVAVPQIDTLRATDKVVVEGEVTDLQGNILTSFNGTVYPAVFDKPQTITTLANDPTSLPATFQVQNNVLFKGKASVTNGKFSFTFKVPKDINYQFGNGKISLYAENGLTDANEAFTGVVIGGIGTGTDNDNVGPEIKPFLNDEKFVNGGITNENPILVVKLADSSGINTAGTGIGHDIIATLDNDNNRFFLLNDFYQSDLDSYQRGVVRFQLPGMEPGPHSLRIKAWDVLNNSNEVVLEFTVVRDEELVIDHVLNYPNPFTTKTSFWFEHNKPGQNLQVRLQIFSVTGRIIKMIQQTINTDGTRSSELEWNGRDEYGDKVGRGTYLYKLSVTAPGGQRKEKIEKLVIF
jgi:hypothetical protein